MPAKRKPTPKFTEGNRVGHHSHKHTGGKEAPWRGTVTLVNMIADHPYRVHWDHGHNSWYKASDIFLIR